MTTVQEPLTDAIPPFPFFIENPSVLNHADLPVNSSRESLPAANVYQQDELRGVDKDHQELSRVNNVRPETSPEPLPDRCQFSFSDGRQCRMARSEIHPSLCSFHAEREEQLFGDPAPGGNVVGAAFDLPELYSACRDLTTAAGVNRALAQVFRLLAQRRISRQEAATFGHLAQLLLRSIHLIRMDVPSSDESQQQDELFSGNKVKREPRDLSVPTPVNKVQRERATSPEPSPVNQVEPERGSDCAPRMPSRRMAPDSSPHAQAAPAPNSQGPQNEHLRKLRVQLEQNEQFQNFET